jgi:hypothetical protein
MLDGLLSYLRARIIHHSAFFARGVNRFAERLPLTLWRYPDYDNGAHGGFCASGVCD